jgi:hypothetical protein
MYAQLKDDRGKVFARPMMAALLEILVSSLSSKITKLFLTNSGGSSTGDASNPMNIFSHVSSVFH